MLSKQFGNIHIYALKLFRFFDPVIIFLGIYPKKIIFDTEKALFIVVQNWKQPKIFIITKFGNGT